VLKTQPAARPEQQDSSGEDEKRISIHQARAAPAVLEGVLISGDTVLERIHNSEVFLAQEPENH